jgi:hypothetical protein
VTPLGLAGLAVLLATPLTNADEPAVRKAASAERPKPDDQITSSTRSIAEQYARIRAEYEAEQAGMRQASNKAATSGKARAAADKRPRHRVVDYSRRMVDLAESVPEDPLARDALLWVINKPGRNGLGPDGDEFARATVLLVRHHGDDPEAVRTGLTLDNQIDPRRDALLLGFNVAAKGHEPKGAGATGPRAVPCSQGPGGRLRPGCRGPAQVPVPWPRQDHS